MGNEKVRTALVSGAGGFIGHHLVKRLKAEGYWVRAVDIKEPEYEPSDADQFLLLDLRELQNCVDAVAGIDDVYNLAADMGGIGYITAFHALLTRNNILINSHMLEAARLEKVGRYLYTSSACVYPMFLQNDVDVTPLHEGQAIPADPEKGYGWEKLFAEQLTTYYSEECDLDIRIVRFHNIYGSLGTYDGGKEKAPAAICRKVAEALPESEIEIWGDGEQTRSFCHINDCVEGLLRIMESGYRKPLNLGTDELVTINQLVDSVCEVAGKSIYKRLDLSKPQGVRGRNSDNKLLDDVLGWSPSISLNEGIGMTYPWIWSQMDKDNRAKPPAPFDVTKLQEARV